MQRRVTDKIRKRLSELKSSGEIPQHIAIIMDGNGRWARKRGLPRVAGHRRGVETVREMVETCTELGVNYLTLYTFSTENWKRPSSEVSTLMRLIVSSLQNETNELHANNVKLNTIGNIQQLPEVVQDELKQALEKTKNNTALTLNLALSYSGRWELTKAIKSICEEYKKDSISLEDIDEKMISDFLDTKDMPDPDLLIRSGGEFRVSNFLLWQIAYSEIFVTDTLWPDFSADNIIEAINDFQSRERRFGLVSEQISKNHKNTENADKHPKHITKV